MIKPERIDVRRDGAALAVLIAAALALQLPLYHRWVSLLDEAAILQIADQINKGEVLYRDAVHVAFPGVFYLTAALFRLFGPSIIVGRILMMLVFTMALVLVYLLARTIAGRTASFLVGLLTVAYRVTAFPHWQMVSYTSIAIFLLMIAVAIVAIGLRRPRAGWPIAAGLVVGLAAVFKQDCSAFIAVAIGSFYFFDGFSTRPLSRSFGVGLRFGFAAAVPPLLAILAFAPAGLLGEVLWQTIWFPLVKQPVWAPTLEGSVQYIGFPPMWPPFEKTQEIRWDGFFSYFPSIVLDFAYLDVLRSPVFQETILPELFVRLVYGLPYAVLAFVMTALGLTAWKDRRASVPWPLHVRRLWLLTFVGVLMIASFSRPRDLVHLMILYLPTLILLAFVIDTVAGRRRGWRRGLVLGTSGAVVVVVLFLAFRVVSLARIFFDTPLEGARSGVRVSQDAAVALNPLVETLKQTEPGTPVAALPYVPAINFLADRPLATRFFALLPLEEFPDRQEQMMADLSRDPRTVTVYSLQHLASIPRPQDYAPRFFEYLITRYRLGQMYNGTRMDGWLFSILEPRKPAKEEVLFDFAKNLDDASAAVDGDESDAGTAPEPSLEVWPFERPVVTLRPSIQPTRSTLSYAVEVPQDARLRLGVAMNPDEWTRFLTSALRFVVRVDGEAVFDETLDPARRFADRRWQFADIPISAGQKAFVFEISTDNEFGVVDNLAGFARPRLVADDRS